MSLGYTNLEDKRGFKIKPKYFAGSDWDSAKFGSTQDIFCYFVSVIHASNEDRPFSTYLLVTRNQALWAVGLVLELKTWRLNGDRVVTDKNFLVNLG